MPVSRSETSQRVVIARWLRERPRSGRRTGGPFETVFEVAHAA